MIKSIYWWPTIYQNVFDFCKACHFCQLAKSVLHKPFGHLHPLETESFPHKIVSIDTIVIGSAASNTQKKYVLVIIDHFSRYVWALSSKNDNAASVVNALTIVFPEKTKKPDKLISDNGKPYISSELKKFCHNRKISHAFITSYHPQTNGMVE